jgi:hypothetical protein
VCIHEDALFPIPPGVLNSFVDGALVDAWLFHRLKGRNKLSLFFLFLLFGGVLFINRDIVRSTIIPQLGLLTGTVFFCYF